MTGTAVSTTGTDPPVQRGRPAREETKRKVLDAALAVFSERGIEAASVDEVAAAAGLTKGAVYSNFRSKSDLVLALMEDYLADRQREAAAVLDTVTGSRQALHDAGAQLMTAIHTGARWQRLLISYAVHGTRDPAVRAALRDKRRELRSSVAGLIERFAEQHGLDLPFDGEEAAVVVLALSNGLAVESSIDEHSVPEDLFGRVLAALAGQR
ncbi:TetR/AcrR family transcriptional regulator [Haloechinothrix sp. YIM 98757]|uniref:TetR/AcrR family transcriptional regulator n=1 Tax=Haloechinothrix aidingensis TaxID=2752311 RepID=A0A838AD55_9PSEU|nr:TetR/AcrR family transcriptional regulator [Haloechinothrix aidingensis]MBA0127153.1 TetR/AcrR family transcriptional regulator [Haloechinothrix aidingensis]